MTDTPQIDRRMLEALICPTTHTTLEYDSDRQELVSKKAKLAFPIRDGIPIMLVDQARSIERRSLTHQIRQVFCPKACGFSDKTSAHFWHLIDNPKTKRTSCAQQCI